MLKNRLIAMIILIAFCIMAMFTAAMAAGNYPWTKNKTLVPNVTGSSPVAGQSGCTTLAITKGAIQGRYSSMDGYVAYEGEVVTAAGAAEPVTWELDGTPVKVGPTAGFTNSGSNTYKRAVARVYSTASRTLKSCVRRW